MQFNGGETMPAWRLPDASKGNFVLTATVPGTGTKCSVLILSNAYPRQGVHAATLNHAAVGQNRPFQEI